MATSASFANFFSGVTGMGNPLTPQQQYSNPFDPTQESQLIPWLYRESRIEQEKQRDPQRLREEYQIIKEYRLEEAQNAARIQAERDKRAFQYQMLANIPKTISDIGSNLAQMRYNAPRLQILAGIPGQIAQAYGAFPEISVPRTRGFS